MDRRTFLTLTTVSALTALASRFLNAGAAHSTSTGELLSSASGFQSVARVSQLQGNQFQTQVGNVALSIIRKSDGSYVAFNRRCTHAGCNVNWQADQNKYVCPCHNSQFSGSGQVVQGPARSPLQSYPVQVQGEQILVKLNV